MIDINIYPREPWLDPILKVYPPVSANKFLPDWYKKHIKNKDKYSDYSAQCPAIRSMVTEGIVIRSWSDIYFFKRTGNLQFNLVLGNNVYENYDYEWIAQHSQKQIEGMDLNDLQNNGILKLVTPFYFETPKGYGLEFLDPFYHIRNTLRFLPARVETDIWNEVNFVFDTNNHIRDYLDGEVLIKAGDPICIAVPYKKTLKSKLRINNYDTEFNKRHMEHKVLNGSRNNKWNEYKKSLGQYEEE